LAIPPEIGLELLYVRRQEELNRVRPLISTLSDDFRSMAATRDQPAALETVVGASEIFQRLQLLQLGAQSESLSIDRPPYVVDHENPDELSKLRTGVVYRALYTQAALSLPSNESLIRGWTSEGEEARAIYDVPYKFVVIDRAVGWMPIFVDKPSAGFLIVHRCALLDAMIDLFEHLWKTALPLDPRLEDSSLQESHEQLSPLDQQLLVLLRAGLKDEAVAQRLSLSVRTVGRRVQGLCDALHVDTRFQLGAEATGRGWLV
jgi:DNA-binding CsgD family transcriptional regulator